MTDIDLNSEEVKRRVQDLKYRQEFLDSTRVPGMASAYSPAFDTYVIDKRFLLDLYDAQQKRIEQLEGCVKKAYVEGCCLNRLPPREGVLTMAKEAMEFYENSSIKKEAGL